MLTEIGGFPTPTPGGISYRNGVVSHVLGALAALRIPAGTPRFGVELTGAIPTASFSCQKPERIQKSARALKEQYTHVRGLLDAYRCDQESGESLDSPDAAFEKARAMLTSRSLDRDIAGTIASLFGVGSETLALHVTSDVDVRGARYDRETFSFSYAWRDEVDVLSIFAPRGGNIASTLEGMLIPELKKYAAAHKSPALVHTR